MSRSAADIRSDFLSFFEAREHRIVPSGPVFPSDDPTLLFTNAGMNQFKDVFLGTGTRDYVRVADTQKCIRVSGKHNDLEEVGVDTYHHTFFEMVGNWSFGDYFKRDAICWAWELLTEVWGLPKERLWVTVFSGDESDGLGADEEAERLWIDEAGVDPSRVLRFDRRDNFWEMGETGPCGPCSEIHIDRGGPDADPAEGADPEIGVNAGNERFIELWNLVFMEFNRIEGGKLTPLPSKHVDTGMGLERIVSVLQGQSSNYDTDLFTPIFARLTELTGITYEKSDRASDIAFRVIADHVRAVSVSMADGALPSNTGRGYVLRRLIRRAARFGKQALGQEAPFLHEVVGAVCDVLSGPFPELAERRAHIESLIKEEEDSFGRTLGRGLAKFEELSSGLGEGDVLEGANAYELYATFGFPRDLVEQMLRERGMTLDADGWESAQGAHQAASKSAGKFKQLLTADQIAIVESRGPSTERSWHESGVGSVEVDAEVVLFEPQAGAEDGEHVIVLSKTAFYPEGGGQVGDRGLIKSSSGSAVAEVLDTKALGQTVVHIAKISSGPGFAEGDAVTASVDVGLRDATRRHHTGTHLLHSALREVVGDHVVQQGSYVGPDRLRFDFANPGGLSPEELDQVERVVNAAVCRDDEVISQEEALEDAKARGVTALFGEKYEDVVRVVDVGGWSTELCGGTHVAAAGQVGPFVLLSERAIQAGVRRIEAVCGEAAVAEIQSQRATLREAAGQLKVTPAEVPERIVHLQGQIKEAKSAAKQQAKGDVEGALEGIRSSLAVIDGVHWAAVKVDGLDMQGIRDLSGRVKALQGDLAVAIMAVAGGGVPFMVLSQGAAQDKGIAAGELAKDLGARVGGGGGGRPDSGQGQGSKPDAIDEALEWVSGRIQEVLGG
jgi:alanyl-tRNA synthetase